MIIDHICFAVSNIDEAADYWNRIFGYVLMTGIVDNVLEKVRVAFLSKENSIMIKLIEPWVDNLPLKEFVKSEGRFHHICFKCDNVEEQIEELRGKGLRLLSAPQPGEAFNNHNIAFMLAKYAMNIELIDTDEKAGMPELS